MIKALIFDIFQNRLYLLLDGGLFITGADILKKSELGTIDLLSGLRGSCGPPESVQGSLVFRNGELLKDAEKRYT